MASASPGDIPAHSPMAPSTPPADWISRKALLSLHKSARARFVWVNIRHALPRSLRSYTRRKHRAIVLWWALRALRRNPRGNRKIWHDLVYGWGNPRWSALPEYLDAIAAAASATSGPVLECGSGLSTLVLATIRAGSGRVCALEEDAEWAARVESALARHGLTADVQYARVRRYEHFDWYSVDPFALPVVSLVVCDGPRGSTRGGRYGLLPVVGARLAPGCRILLDDTARDEERHVLDRWATEYHARIELFEGDEGYAEVWL